MGAKRRRAVLLALQILIVGAQRTVWALGLEVSRGGVEEEQVDLEVQEVGAGEEDRLKRPGSPERAASETCGA